MSKSKFLFLYRMAASESASRWKQSPEEMQAAYAQWSAWKSKFGAEILDNGEGLKPDGAGAVYKAGAVTDGPYIETKEVMAGYTFIETSSLARAVEIARECPINQLPGASVEIRELTKYW